MATCLQFGSQIADFFDCLCAQSRASCKQEFCQKVNAPSMHELHRPMHPPCDPRPHELTLFVLALVRTRCSHTHAHTSRCSAPWPATGILRVRTMKPIIASDVARRAVPLFCVEQRAHPFVPCADIDSPCTLCVNSVQSLLPSYAIGSANNGNCSRQCLGTNRGHLCWLCLLTLQLTSQAGPTSGHRFSS
jgi:hypothetical protein